MIGVITVTVLLLALGIAMVALSSKIKFKNQSDDEEVLVKRTKIMNVIKISGIILIVLALNLAVVFLIKLIY